MVVCTQWEWLQQWKQRNWLHRGIWAAALWIKEADGMSQVKSAWQAEENCRAHPCCCEAALAAMAGQAKAVQLQQYSSPTAWATSQAATKMTSLQPTQRGGWLLLPLLLFNFLNHGNYQDNSTRHQSPTAVCYEEKKYSSSASQQPTPESSEGNKKQSQTLHLKRKNHP